MTGFSFAADVSAYQSHSLDWGSMGLHMGFAKASEGVHSRESMFGVHIEGIRSAGLVPAAYHFAWPTQNPVSEAANYTAAVHPHVRPGFVHALDLERYSDGRNYSGLSDTAIARYAHVWVAEVKAAFPGQKVVVYTSGDDLSRGHFPDNADGLWYPDYPVQGRTFGQAAASARPTPSGHTVWGWQFTSEPMDRTLIYMSPDALRAWASGTPTEVDMPLTPQDIEAIALAVNGYRNADADAASVKAGRGHIPDVYGYTVTTHSEVEALRARVDSLAVSGVDLDALAARVADVLSKRLEG
jgi:hypothetical protein